MLQLAKHKVMVELNSRDFIAVGVETKIILIDLLKYARTHSDCDLSRCHKLASDYFKRIDHKANSFLSIAKRAGISVDREYFIENTLSR